MRAFCMAATQPSMSPLCIATVAVPIAACASDFCASLGAFLTSAFRFSMLVLSQVIGIIVACITGFTPIHIVAETCSAGTIFAFLCSCVGILVLRRLYPDHPRGFRCPAVHIIAPLGFICCAFIFSELSSHTLILFTGWTILGLIIYMVYGRKHSLLQQEGK